MIDKKSYLALVANCVNDIIGNESCDNDFVDYADRLREVYGWEILTTAVSICLKLPRM